MVLTTLGNQPTVADLETKTLIGNKFLPIECDDNNNIFYQ